MGNQVQHVDIVHVTVPLEKPVTGPNFTVTTREIVLVEVSTEDAWGVGYRVCRDKGEARLLFTACEIFAEAIIGCNVVATERGYELMRRRAASMIGGLSGGNLNAIATLDIACWDAKSRYLNMPLWQMLGGAQESVPAYASGVWYHRSPDEVTAEIVDFVEAGFDCIKMRVGLKDFELDLERIQAARSAFEGELMLEIGTSWDLPTARIALKELRHLNILWVEDPLPPNLPRQLRMLREFGVPLAGGERASDVSGVKEVVEAGLYDYLILDLYQVGGLSGWIRCNALAEAHGFRVSSHVASDLSLHALCGLGNSLYLEWVDRSRPLFEQYPQVIGGRVEAADQPGFALTPDRDYVNAHATGRKRVS